MGRKKKSEEVLAETIAALDPAPEAVGAAGEIETKPRRNPTQPPLDGFEEPVHQDITDAALSYANFRDDRMEKAKHEKRAYLKLANLMEEHGLKEYADRSTGIYITREEVEAKYKVKLGTPTGEADAKFSVLTPDPDKPIGEDVMESENYGGTDESDEDAEPS